MPAHLDDLDRVKGWLKRTLGQAYYAIGIHVFAPTSPLDFLKVIRRHVERSSALVVDGRSGNHRLDPDIICVDMFN